jgi:hypothetical protein
MHIERMSSSDENDKKEDVKEQPEFFLKRRKTLLNTIKD